MDKPTVIYDADLKGFGLRVMPKSERNPKGSKTWIVEYRPGVGGRSVAKKRITLGSIDAITPEVARDTAKTMLAAVRLGADPNAERAAERAARTVRDLERLYSAEFDQVRKPRTIQLYRGYWLNHVLPTLGSATARNLTGNDLARLRRSIAIEHKITANRVLTLLTHFFGWAGKAGYVPRGFNPCQDIERFRESSRERFLSFEEIGRVGDAIRVAEEEGVPWLSKTGKPLSKHAPRNADFRLTKIDPDAADAIRLLILTGARLREILHLRWSEYDRQRGVLMLADSKSGAKTIVLGRPAIQVLERLWLRAGSAVPTTTSKSLQMAPVSPYVFPSRDLSAPKADLKRPWGMITRLAELEGVRLHDLRHSFASVGAASSLGLPIIGRMLGHANPSTTARYAHLDADPIRRATDLVSGTISKALEGEFSSSKSIIWPRQ